MYRAKGGCIGTGVLGNTTSRMARKHAISKASKPLDVGTSHLVCREVSWISVSILCAVYKQHPISHLQHPTVPSDINTQSNIHLNKQAIKFFSFPLQNQESSLIQSTKSQLPAKYSTYARNSVNINHLINQPILCSLLLPR